MSLVVPFRCDSAAAQIPSDSVPPREQRSAFLAAAFAGLVEQAIPREYEKRHDWGQTKNITVGIRHDGLRLHSRKKPVKHGTWTHYKIRLAAGQPEQETGSSRQPLDVEIRNLSPANDGRFGFTLLVSANFDLWGRVKVYRYGVHLIALEIVGDAAIDLALDCEIGVRLQTHTGKSGVALDPRVVGARLDMTDFHLRRISNAKGPIIRELGEEFPRFFEREMQGPSLVTKLNRAIDKNRERLELSFGEMLSLSR